MTAISVQLPAGVPPAPKLYHITHVDNLARIVDSGALLSDRRILEGRGPNASIGISRIKQRRLDSIRVGAHPGTRVGDHVPFNFCPRSVMLYVIARGNHADLTYRDGEGPIVHLVADLIRVVEWCQTNSVRWAFSLGNAGAFGTQFRTGVDRLGELDWGSISATDFRDSRVSAGKQSEFLVHGALPIHLIERVGVRSQDVATRANEALRGVETPPTVEVHPDWYYGY